MKYWSKKGDPTTAILKFYGEIGVWWNGSADFTNTLEEIEKNFKNVEIKLHCYGGQVFEGNVIYNAIANTSLNVKWFIDGVAASMGGIIPLSKGEIIMAENAYWMVHAPTSSGGGTSKQLFAEAKLLKSMEQTAIKVFVRKTGKKETEVATWFDGSNWWFSASECLAMGLCVRVDAPVDTTGVVTKPDTATPVEGVFARYTALTTSQPEAIDNDKKNNMDKAALIALYGLTTVTAESSDTAIMAAITAQKNAQDAQLQTLKDAAKSGIEVQASAIVAAKEAEIKSVFTPEQKASFMAVAAGSGVEVLKTVLASIKPVVSLEGLLNGAAGGANASAVAADRKGWDWKKWEKEDPEGLTSMEATNIEAFKALYNKEFPNNKAVFA